MSTFIRGENNFCIYIRGTSLCIAGTMVRYLGVIIVVFFGSSERICWSLSGKGVMVWCIYGWVWFLFIFVIIIVIGSCVCIHCIERASMFSFEHHDTRWESMMNKSSDAVFS